MRKAFIRAAGAFVVAMAAAPLTAAAQPAGNSGLGLGGLFGAIAAPSAAPPAADPKSASPQPTSQQQPLGGLFAIGGAAPPASSDPSPGVDASAVADGQSAEPVAGPSGVAVSP